MFGASAGTGVTLPFVQVSLEPRPLARDPVPVADGVLPFGPGGACALTAAAVPVPASDAAATVLLAPAKPEGARLPPPPAPPPPVEVAPVVVAAPPGLSLANPVVDRASIGQRMVKDPAPVLEMAPLVAPAKSAAPAHEPSIRVDEIAAKRGWKPAGAPKEASLTVVAAVPGSALAASNAAVESAAARSPAVEAPVPAKAPPLRVVTTPRDVIELVWFDPAFVSRMRRKPGWKEIMAQVKQRPNDEEIAGDAPPEKRQELRDRRDVFALLARGQETDAKGIDEAIAEAIGEDGVFVPPLVLVAGELELPFDEVEELKATIAAVTPLIAGDVRLQGAVDTAQKLLQSPWLNGASEIAAGLMGKIKEAFAQGNRALPARYLEQHTERMLLHQRAYQKRMVLGKASIRGLLAMGGGTSGSGVPVYVLETLGQELPAFLRFGVRMVVEARSRVDQYEVQGVALRGVAVGRVITRARG